MEIIDSYFKLGTFLEYSVIMNKLYSITKLAYREGKTLTDIIEYIKKRNECSVTYSNEDDDVLPDFSFEQCVHQIDQNILQGAINYQIGYKHSIFHPSNLLVKDFNVQSLSEIGMVQLEFGQMSSMNYIINAANKYKNKKATQYE